MVPEFVTGNLPGEHGFTDETKGQAGKGRPDHCTHDRGSDLANPDHRRLREGEGHERCDGDQDDRTPDEGTFPGRTIDKGAAQRRDQQANQSSDRGDGPQCDGGPAIRGQKRVQEWTQAVPRIRQEKIEDGERGDASTGRKHPDHHAFPHCLPARFAQVEGRSPSGLRLHTLLKIAAWASR